MSYIVITTWEDEFLPARMYFVQEAEDALDLAYKITRDQVFYEECGKPDDVYIYKVPYINGCMDLDFVANECWSEEDTWLASYMDISSWRKYDVL